MNETAYQAARRDMVQETHNNGLVLELPKSILFDADEFFSHYKDPVVDRYREHQIYMLKREDKSIIKRKPKR